MLLWIPFNWTVKRIPRLLRGTENLPKTSACGQHEHKDRRTGSIQTCWWHGSMRLSWSAAEKHRSPVNYWRHARHISGHTPRPFLATTTRKVRAIYILTIHFTSCKSLMCIIVWISVSFYFLSTRVQTPQRPVPKLIHANHFLPLPLWVLASRQLPQCCCYVWRPPSHDNVFWSNRTLSFFCKVKKKSWFKSAKSDPLHPARFMKWPQRTSEHASWFTALAEVQDKLNKLWNEWTIGIWRARVCNITCFLGAGRLSEGG